MMEMSGPSGTMGLAFHRRSRAVPDVRWDFGAGVWDGRRSSQGYFARAAERLVLDYTMFEIKILRGEKQLSGSLSPFAFEVSQELYVFSVHATSSSVQVSLE